METKIREISKLISFENNERLCIESLSDKIGLCNSNLSKNRPSLVFIDSLSTNDVAILGWFAVNEKE